MTIEIDEEEKQMAEEFNKITSEILALFAKIPNGCPTILCENCSVKNRSPLCRYLENKARIPIDMELIK